MARHIPMALAGGLAAIPLSTIHQLQPKPVTHGIMVPRDFYDDYHKNQAKAFREAQASYREKRAQGVTVQQLIQAVMSDASLSPTQKSQYIAMINSALGGRPNWISAINLATLGGGAISALIARYFGAGLPGSALAGVAGAIAARTATRAVTDLIHHRPVAKNMLSGFY